MTKTTLLIPTLNSEKYLDKTLDSLKRNKKSIYKIFIIDAGSTDNTTQIIKKKKLKNLRLFFFKKNIAKSLDFGLSKIKTKYFSRIDSDDMASKNRFKKQIDLLNRNKDIAVVGSNFCLLKDNKTIKISDLPISYESIITKFLIDGDISLAHPSTTLRVMSVKKVGGYKDYNYSEDYNLWIRLIFNKYKLCNLSENLTNIRIHEKQKSTTNKDQSIKSMMNSFSRHVKKIFGIKVNNIYLNLFMIKYIKKDRFCKNDIKKFYKKKFIITVKKFHFFKCKINASEFVKYEYRNISYNLNFLNFIYYFYFKKNYILNSAKILFKHKINNFTFVAKFYIYFFFIILKYIISKLKK